MRHTQNALPFKGRVPKHVPLSEWNRLAQTFRKNGGETHVKNVRGKLVGSVHYGTGLRLEYVLT